jgi:serine/threonine protein kinase
MLELTKGSRLADRYTLERPLGRGGEAVIWLARDRMTRASVALKIVPAAGGARLRDEWQTNLRLMHAHIVRVFEFHEDQGAAFYSQQYVDGPDLGALAGNSLDEILPPIGLLADALRYAHAKDMVHRDVKAANVLLDYNGVPYLGDFGVAAAVGATATGGSPVTASPQVLQGMPAQPSDDIYALGVLLHELIAGYPPGQEPLRSAVGEPIPEDILALVASMLDDEATGRPDAQSVIDTLTAAGFRPGPARSQVAARPVVEDEQIERVSTVRHGRAAVSAAPQPTAAEARGLNSRTVAGVLGFLVVILLGVVFLLPDAVEERDKPRPPDAGREALPIAADPVAADAPASADDDLESSGERVTRDYRPENKGLDNERVLFNESDADYSDMGDAEKLRFNVDGILGELVSTFQTLERRGVQRWAPVPYKRAQDYYQSGDDAYLRKDWVAAEVAYLDALTVLEPLFEQVEPEFEKALAGAREAFDSGDRTEALRLYELAVAITPNHPEARAGLQRAQNLEAVLQLVDSGEAFEDELELDAAEASFQQAIDLDPNWAPAVEGLARVRTTLIPGSREPADGLLQVDQGLRLNNITTLEQEALALEQSEHWDAAATTYEEILAVDSNLSFAIDGLSQARRMNALHIRLDDYIRDPDRLSVPSVLQEATKLVIEVTTMGEIGPRLAGQRDELSRLLKRAATPVSIELVSDNQTDVSIYKVGVLGRFTNRTLELRPGTYVAVGARAGYRDVRLEFRVAPEEEMLPVVVRCEEQI